MASPRSRHCGRPLLPSSGSRVTPTRPRRLPTGRSSPLLAAPCPPLGFVTTGLPQFLQILPEMEARVGDGEWVAGAPCVLSGVPASPFLMSPGPPRLHPPRPPRNGQCWLQQDWPQDDPPHPPQGQAQGLQEFGVPAGSGEGWRSQRSLTQKAQEGQKRGRLHPGEEREQVRSWAAEGSEQGTSDLRAPLGSLSTGPVHSPSLTPGGR